MANHSNFGTLGQQLLHVKLAEETTLDEYRWKFTNDLRKWKGGNKKCSSITEAKYGPDYFPRSMTSNPVTPNWLMSSCLEWARVVFRTALKKLIAIVGGSSNSHGFYLYVTMVLPLCPFNRCYTRSGAVDSWGRAFLPFSPWAWMVINQRNCVKSTTWTPN